MEYARDHLAPYLQGAPRRVLRTAQDHFRQDPARRTARRERMRHTGRARRSPPSTATRTWWTEAMKSPMTPDRPTSPSSRRPSARTSSAPPPQHPDVEALVDVAQGCAGPIAELERRDRPGGAGLDGRGIAKGDRVGIWAPNRAEWTIVQYATAKIGAILVNINPAYRTHELAYVLNQSGVPDADLGHASSRPRTIVGDGRRGAQPKRPTLTEVDLPGHRGLGRRCGARRGAPEDELAARAGRRWPTPIRSTSSTPRAQRVSRRARRCRTATSSTTASSSPRRINLRSGRPAVHPGAVLPLLRHGDGQPGLHHPRCHDGDSRTRLRPGCRRWKPLRPSAVRRVRGADDVHRRCRTIPTFAERGPIVVCAPASWRARSARSR